LDAQGILAKQVGGMAEEFNRANGDKKKSPKQKVNKGGMNPGAMDIFVRRTWKVSISSWIVSDRFVIAIGMETFDVDAKE
jgi:hypothetical protein